MEHLELVAGAGDQVLRVGDGLWESWSLVVARAGGEVEEWKDEGSLVLTMESVTG